jgi:hypothetical protein
MAIHRKPIQERIDWFFNLAGMAPTFAVPKPGSRANAISPNIRPPSPC